MNYLLHKTTFEATRWSTFGSVFLSGQCVRVKTKERMKQAQQTLESR